MLEGPLNLPQPSRPHPCNRRGTHSSGQRLTALRLNNSPPGARPKPLLFYFKALSPPPVAIGPPSPRLRLPSTHRWRHRGLPGAFPPRAFPLILPARHRPISRPRPLPSVGRRPRGRAHDEARAASRRGGPGAPLRALTHPTAFPPGRHSRSLRRPSISLCSSSFLR